MKLVIPALLLGNITVYCFYRPIVGSDRQYPSNFNYWIIIGSVPLVATLPIILVDNILDYQNTSELTFKLAIGSIPFHILLSCFRRFKISESMMDKYRRDRRDKDLSAYHARRKTQAKN